MKLIRSIRTALARSATAARGTVAVVVAVPTIALLGTGATRAGAVTGCTTSWKTPGTSGVFEVAANWTNGVPSLAKNVCIPASATPYTVTEHSSANTHKVVVGSGATLHMESTTAAVTLTVGNGGVTNSGTIELVSSGATPRVTTLSVIGAFVENSGTVKVLQSGAVGQRIDATLHNTPNGTLDIANTSMVNTLNNDGFVTIAASSSLYMFTLANYNGTTHTLSRGAFDIAGALRVPFIDINSLDAGLSIVANGVVVDSATNNNALPHLNAITANGSFALADGAQMLTSSLTNHGRLLLGNGSALTTAGDYTQAGVYTSLSPGSRLTASDGTVYVTAGDIVGAGTIQAPVINAGGTLFPAPQIVITASYTQQAGATLSTRVGNGAGNGMLVVDGDAALGGTLDVTADGTLSPQVGMSFTVVQAGRLLSTFAKVVSSGLPSPAEFQVNAAFTDVTATIVVRYNDADPYVTYGGWYSHTNSGTLGGTFRFTTTATDTATFAFTGPSIAWNTLRGSEMGKAQVLIDGANKGTFDLYSATLQSFTQSFTGLAAGKHTITIRPTGIKNTRSTGTVVAVDGFKVGAAFTDDTSRSIGWSGWAGVRVGTDGYRMASAAGRTAQIFATLASGVAWITRTGPDQGKAQVFVDGVLATTVSLYSATVHTGVRISIGTTAGNHRVTITVLGTKEAASTNTAVSIDSLIAQ